MKTIEGDLIKLAEKGEFDMIVQGCNCFHKMKSGLAGKLASKYPQVLKADKEKTAYGDRQKLGTWSAVDLGKFIVINAYTQYSYDRKKDVFDYEAFEKFLNDFILALMPDGSSFRILPIKKRKIGFPKIGSGLAGGDWGRISKMIENFAENIKDYADVTIVEYGKNGESRRI